MPRWGLVSFVLALVLCQPSPIWAQQTLSLPSGAKLILYDINTLEPLNENGTKTLRATVGVPGGEDLDKRQLSVIADEFFLFFFGVYAEKEGFESAAIWFKKEVTAGPLSFSTADPFVYNLQENGVWEPGHDSLLDNDPFPKATAFNLPTGKRIFVEFAGLTYLQQVRREGWGSDYWSETSFRTDPQAVYAQSREYWNLLKDRIDPSIGIAGIFAFDKPRKGFFHFRKHMYLIIRANKKGEWQDLPPTLDEVMGQKSEYIQASYGPSGLETVWPEQ